VVKGTPARWFGPRSQRAPRDDGRVRLSARERLRLGAFPPRLLSIFCDIATGDAIFNNFAWPARPPRTSAGVFSVFVAPLVSISNSQRRPISNANWIGTVHGLPINLLTPRPVCPSYLALALLVPFDWPEPFGLVMIEAMAFGTPVIAFNRGSVPEVIEDGLTGYLVEDEMSAIGAVCGSQRLSRSGIRMRFEERFTARPWPSSIWGFTRN
jgi:glycosyltransferase involved in cell wall biosynthesis